MRCVLLLLYLGLGWHSSIAQVHFVTKAEKAALVHNSDTLTPFVFTEFTSFREGYCWVNKGELYSFVDTLGNAIAPYIFTDVSAFEQGYAVVSTDSTFTYINTSGRLLGEQRYQRALPFSKHGLAAVQKDSLWGVIDTTGTEVIPPSYTHVPRILSRNFIVVGNTNSWGVLDWNNRVRHPLIYRLITTEGVGYIGNIKYYLGLM